MGLRFRRSINLGFGVRINFSNSGIGYSFGGRGFRTTVSPRGRVTRTISIPGTGLSYSTSYSANRRRYANSNHSSADNGLGSRINTVSADIDNFQSAEYSELLSKIEKTRSIHESATTFMIAMIILSLFSPVVSAIRDDNSGFIVWLIIMAIGIGVKLFMHKNVAVDLDYDMDYDTTERYENYCNAWALVCKSMGKQQQISTAAVTDRRVHSGANSSLELKPISIVNKLPPYIKTNVEVYVLRLYNETICLLPDKLLIIRGKQIGAINYDDISVQYDKQRIISGILYDDSEKVGETWRYVNNNGSPDRRYNNNPKRYICLCGEITLTSASGLNVILVLSNNQIIDELKGTQ